MVTKKLLAVFKVGIILTDCFTAYEYISKLWIFNLKEFEDKILFVGKNTKIATPLLYCTYKVVLHVVTLGITFGF